MFRYEGLPDNVFQFTCPSRSTTAVALPVLLTGRFQFTCPSRSTTSSIIRFDVSVSSFNSRAPRGARPLYIARFLSLSAFQFTCPSRSTTKLSLLFPVWIQFQFTCPSRSTTVLAVVRKEFQQFQFTCPSRSTTSLIAVTNSGTMVSIHVPLAEHDLTHATINIDTSSFNSRAPRGARRT